MKPKKTTGGRGQKERRPAKPKQAKGRRTLSLKQPYASLVIDGRKKEEYRHQRISPGELVIHASRRPAGPECYDAVRKALRRPRMTDDQVREFIRSLPTGAVLGTVRVVDSERRADTVANRVEVKRKLARPVAAKGNSSVWYWDGQRLRKKPRGE